MRTRVIIAAAAASLVLLTACGSDSKSSTASTETTFADYCAQINDYKDNANAFDSVFASDTPDPAKTEEAFTTMKDRLQSLADNAPADIKADVETVNQATGTVIEIFAKYEWDVIKLAASTEDATKFQTLLSDQKVNDASARLDTWGQENCGFAEGE